MILNHFLLGRVRQILHTGFGLLKVDVAETTVEEDFARIQLEEKTELRIVDDLVASKVEECIVEIGQCLFEVAEQKVGDTLLEVCDS